MRDTKYILQQSSCLEYVGHSGFDSQGFAFHDMQPGEDYVDSCVLDGIQVRSGDIIDGIGFKYCKKKDILLHESMTKYRGVYSTVSNERVELLHVNTKSIEICWKDTYKSSYVLEWESMNHASIYDDDDQWIGSLTFQESTSINKCFHLSTYGIKFCHGSIHSSGLKKEILLDGIFRDFHEIEKDLFYPILTKGGSLYSYQFQPHEKLVLIQTQKTFSYYGHEVINYLLFQTNFNHQFGPFGTWNKLEPLETFQSINYSTCLFAFQVISMHQYVTCLKIFLKCQWKKYRLWILLRCLYDQQRCHFISSSTFMILMESFFNLPLELYQRIICYL